MSGRTLHLRDGKLITNRKTDRRQSRPREPMERLIDAHERQARRAPTAWNPSYRLSFVLPKTLQGFVASGDHDHGIYVLKGLVQVTRGSATECFVEASQYLAKLFRDYPAFTMLGVMSCSREPERFVGRHLVVIRGGLIACAGNFLPRIYEVAA